MAPRLKNKKLYEGSTKAIFEGPEPGTLIQHFKDQLSVKGKEYTIIGKGPINSRISEFLMVKLAEIGVANHFMRTTNMREHLVREIEIIPVQVVIRNIAAGGLAKRLQIDEGYVLPKPIIEFYLKNRELNYPFVSEDHIVSLGWAEKIEIDEIKEQCVRINDFLRGLFLGVNLRLVDFRIEFGRVVMDNIEQIILGDEITPDCCRLWDVKTNAKFDRERIQNGEEELKGVYQEIANRLNIFAEND